jgi:hypothetical protein
MLAPKPRISPGRKKAAIKEIKLAAFLREKRRIEVGIGPCGADAAIPPAAVKVAPKPPNPSYWPR